MFGQVEPGSFLRIKEVNGLQKNTVRKMRQVLALALVATFAIAAFAVAVVGGARADATSDQLNASVSLLSSLLTALIPLIVILAIFSLIFGLLMGKNGVFHKFEHE